MGHTAVEADFSIERLISKFTHNACVISAGPLVGHTAVDSVFQVMGMRTCIDVCIYTYIDIDIDIDIDIEIEIEIDIDMNTHIYIYMYMYIE